MRTLRRKPSVILFPHLNNDDHLPAMLFCTSLDHYFKTASEKEKKKEKTQKKMSKELYNCWTSAFGI
jgi:hypothetical protein